MPKAYEAIRNALMQREGLPLKQAKSKAARIFISRGVNKSQRSMMASMLQSDRSK